MSLLRVELPRPKEGEYWWTVVPGEPKPKERPRHTRFGTYTPKKTRLAEAWLRRQIRQAHPKIEMDSHRLFGLRCVFYTERKITQNTNADNLQKLVADACEGLFYEKDSQIREWYAIQLPANGRPRSEILFHFLTQDYLDSKGASE